MKKLFLLPLLFSFFALSAQNWQPGIVIVNETDTLFGEINFRIPRLNQEQAVFRADANSPVQTFSPGEIVGYRIMSDGNFFVSKTIEINNQPRLVFVEFMVQGMLNLYYYIDENRQEHFFFEDENGSLFAITREDDIIDGLQVRRDNRFDGMIRHRFQDQPSIAHNPRPFEFNQATMIEIVRTYHNLTCPIGSECIVFERQRPDRTRMYFRFSAYTALEMNVFGNVFGFLKIDII